LGAADEANARQAVASFRDGSPRRLDDPRVVRQPEVVVGAEVQNAPAVDGDFRPLRRFQGALLLVQARRADLLERTGILSAGGGEHRFSATSSLRRFAGP